MNTCDGNGRIVFSDDFEDEVFSDSPSVSSRWSGTMQGPFGAGGSVGIRTGWAKSGHRAARLTAHAILLSQPTMSITLPRPQSRRIGIEFTFGLGANIQDLTLYTYLYRKDGFGEHEAFLRVLPQSAQLMYQNSGGQFQSLAGLGTAPIPNFRYTMKLVIDQDTRQYVRAWLNGDVYPMNGIAYYALPQSTQYNYILVQLIASPNIAANAVANIDDFILTDNEP